MIMTIFAQPVEAVFEEWHRRWTENPDGYRSWAEALAEPSDTYGRAATRTLLAIAQEMYDADEAMHPWERPKEENDHDSWCEATVGTYCHCAERAASADVPGTCSGVGPCPRGLKRGTYDRRTGRLECDQCPGEPEASSAC